MRRVGTFRKPAPAVSASDGSTLTHSSVLSSSVLFIGLCKGGHVKGLSSALEVSLLNNLRIHFQFVPELFVPDD